MVPCLRALVTLALFWLLMPAPLRAEADLQELHALTRAGAGQLALRLLDRDQPGYGANPGAWMVWERERIDLLQLSGRWTDLIRRLSDLPAGLPVDFHRWADTWRAKALLERDRGEEARVLLRELIWDFRHPPDASELSAWRQLIIRSYLSDGLYADAVDAMLRYRQDYGPGDERLRILRARLLLREDRPEAAVRLLESVTEAEGRVLALWARFQADLLPSAATRVQAQALMTELDDRPALQSAVLQIEARAAQREGDHRAAIAALERALIIGPPQDAPFALAADDLWRTYRQEGLRLGNQLRLLVGDDAIWLRTASQMAGKTPQEARALLAVVAVSSISDAARHSAYDQIAATIPLGQDALLLSLYGGVAAESVPNALRRRIAEAFLSKGSIPAASAWLVELAPATDDAQSWRDELLRARVLLRGGRVKAGVAALRGLAEDPGEWEASKVDQFLQVVFDLQSLGEHAKALEFFRRLGQRTLDSQPRRELFFWMAESRRALKQPEMAALLYLRSASWPDPSALDPWAQTARFHAASALEEAGLLEDAGEQYRRLLRVAAGEERKQALRRALEQLQLRVLKEKRSEEVP